MCLGLLRRPLRALLFVFIVPVQPLYYYTHPLHPFESAPDSPSCGLLPYLRWMSRVAERGDEKTRTNERAVLLFFLFLFFFSLLSLFLFVPHRLVGALVLPQVSMKYKVALKPAPRQSLSALQRAWPRWRTPLL